MDPYTPVFENELAQLVLKKVDWPCILGVFPI